MRKVAREEEEKAVEVEPPVTARYWFVVMVTETYLYGVGNGVTYSLVF